MGAVSSGATKCDMTFGVGVLTFIIGVSKCMFKWMGSVTGVACTQTMQKSCKNVICVATLLLFCMVQNW